MIIKDLRLKKEEATSILYEVFKTYYPNENYGWFQEQVKDIDWSLSLAYIFDSKIVGIYLLSNINCEKKEGRGLRGEALAVLKSHRGKRFYEQFIQYIKQEYDFDYIWGTADKKLGNINFWTKYRSIIKEDSNRYYTFQKLKT